MRGPTYWRRRWCAWRRHPTADWSPIAAYWPPKYELIDGVVTKISDEIEIKQWRCALHDKEER